MARGTIDRLMFPFQREFGLGVVEALIHRLQRNFLPAARAVARLAGLREAAVVRVLMAVGTLVEWDANIPWLAIRSIRVALGALHLRVQTGKRISSFRVIELSDIDLLPVNEVVAGDTVLPKASFVLILMAIDARRGNSEVCPVGILNFDRRAFLRRDVRWIVALVAGQTRMFPLEHVTSILVVERLDVPFDQWKIFAVVFGVAAGALLT